MVKVILKGGIFGGLVLFVWSAISWTCLPWHAKAFNDFTNETQVAKVIAAQVSKSGLYMLSSMSHQKATGADTKAMKPPFVFTTVRLEDCPPMSRMLINELIIQILAAALATSLLVNVKGMGYMGRVGLVTLFGLVAGIVSYGPLWNWFGFPLNYTAIALADLIIGWYLAGFVIAGVTRGR